MDIKYFLCFAKLSSWSRIPHRYNNEEERLYSFYGTNPWPLTFIRPLDLAISGFFRLESDGDKVRCFSCLGVLGEWEDGDVPFDEHRRHFPKCEFIAELSLSTRSQGVKHNVTGDYLSVRHEANSASLSSQLVSKMYSYEARLVSYDKFLLHTSIAESLARAGFYSLQYKQFVACFACGISLSINRMHGNPISHHMEWDIGCSFLRQRVLDIKTTSGKIRFFPPTEQAKQFNVKETEAQRRQYRVSNVR